VDTQFGGVFSAVVLFNPFSETHHDLVEVALNIPEGIAAYELINADKTVIPHEFIGSKNNVLANVLLRKSELRDTIGAITDGRVAGAAIVNVKISRQGTTVSINAILDDKGQPNIPEWHQAEKDIAAYESDPGVTHFLVLARTPQASKIRFITPDIPTLGWRTLWVRTIPAQPSAPAATVNPLLKPFIPLALRFAQSDLGMKLLAAFDRGDEKKPPFAIENEYYCVEAAPDGTLTAIDKRTNTIYSGLNRFVDGGDAGDEYNYSPPENDPFFAPKLTRVKVFRHQLVPTLEIEYKLDIPAKLSPDRKTRSHKRVIFPITSHISLAPGIPRIDIHTEVDNRARDHRLRVHFPAPFAVQAADHDGHFEVVRRPLGVPGRGENWVEDPRPEVPQHAFTDISDGKIGLMVSNRGLPEVEVIKTDDGAHTEIALTLLRSVGWLSRDDLPVRQGHAGPALETPGGQVQGKSVFDYSIIPHVGDWRKACQQAYAFQTELRAFETGIHIGEIPAQGNFVKSLSEAFIISAVKATENGKGWLVRGYNISSDTIQLGLKPLRRFLHAALVNLAEEELSLLPIANDGSVTISAAGHKIVSVMFSD
jgi:mannosylglycerate hydrolase